MEYLSIACIYVMCVHLHISQNVLSIERESRYHRKDCSTDQGEKGAQTMESGPMIEYIGVMTTLSRDGEAGVEETLA